MNSDMLQKNEKLEGDEEYSNSSHGRCGTHTDEDAPKHTMHTNCAALSRASNHPARARSKVQAEYGEA
eukprot:scaffold173639_cov18-Tisochrysis_lutea.AAC.1